MMRLLGPLAFAAVARRDGLAGWQQHRRAFRTLATSSPDEAGRDALDALRRMLLHAWTTVPFYRERWRAEGFVPGPATSLEDLRQLPLLTKADVRDRKAELLSRDGQARPVHLDYTGGTTGTQTAFYRDNACRVARFGRQWGILERCGYRPGDRRALIWGVHGDLLPADGSRRLAHRLRRMAAADETLSCARMTRESMRDYHRRLLVFRPTVIYGYPNAIEEFACFIEEHRLTPVRAARVLCTAERLRPRQRELFVRSFGAEVFSLYCSREHGCVAFECGRHNGFHIDTGSVIVEILRDGRAAGPGESGQIVVTDLLNYGMPFIRYVMGDVATAAAGPCGCGCPLPTFANLDGRTADTVYLPDGATVSGVMVEDLFMELPAVTHLQIVQHERASLDVQVVLKPGAGADIEAAMRRELRSLFGPEIGLRIHVVDDIPRNPRSGKYQLVVSHLTRTEESVPP